MLILTGGPRDVRTLTFDPALSTVFVGFQGAEDDADNSGVGIDRIQFGPTLIPGGGAVATRLDHYALSAAISDLGHRSPLRDAKASPDLLTAFGLQ